MKSSRATVSIVLALAALSPLPGFAAAQGAHPFVEEVFDTHGVERADCPAGLIGKLRDDIRLACASGGESFGRFQKSWERFVKARTGISRRGSNRSWSKKGKGRRVQYVFVDASWFMIAHQSPEGTLAIAWSDKSSGACSGLRATDAPAPLEARGTPSIPRVLSKHHPAFPAEARRERVSGAVMIQAMIGTTGAVTDLCIIAETPRDYGFGRAAQHAIEQWVYEPGALDGKPVEVPVTITMDFELSGSPAPMLRLLTAVFWRD